MNVATVASPPLVDVGREDEVTSLECDENHDSLENQVFENDLLLRMIMTFVQGPPHPITQAQFLSLRLVCPLFNEEVLNLKGPSKDKWPIKLTLSKDMDEDQVKGMDGRLCRDVTLDFQNDSFCHSDEAPNLFSTLVKGHGTYVQVLKMDRVLGKDFGIVLTLINENCPNLRSLVLSKDRTTTPKGHEAIDEEWSGHFEHLHGHLEAIKVSSLWHRGSNPVDRHVTKVMNSLLTVSPNLKELTMDGEMGLQLDNQKLRRLKHLKLTIYGIDKGFVAMINAVSKTLETLELCHSVEFENRDGMANSEEPTFQNLPSLREVKFEFRRDIRKCGALLQIILEGGAPCLETMNVSSLPLFSASWEIDVFWRHFFSSGWTTPLTTLKTLKLVGQGRHPPQVSQTERLRKLQNAFPNLSSLAYIVFISSLDRLFRVDPTRRIIEVLVALGRWDTPIKEIQLGLNFDCSMEHVVGAFEAVGEGFFTNGLESLCLSLESGRGNEAADIVQTEEEYERLTRTLLWTRNMKRVTFHKFGILSQRLADFVANNELPVTFHANPALRL